MFRCDKRTISHSRVWQSLPSLYLLHKLPVPLSISETKSVCKSQYNNVGFAFFWTFTRELLHRKTVPTPPLDQVLLIIETSRSHSDTPPSIALLWTSDQPVTEAFTWQHTTVTRHRHYAPRGNKPYSHQVLCPYNVIPDIFLVYLMIFMVLYTEIPNVYICNIKKTQLLYITPLFVPYHPDDRCLYMSLNML